MHYLRGGFFIRPLASLIIYLCSYATYYFAIALTISDHQILLSNRMNGATAAAMGLFLSNLLWHYNYTSIKQQERIDAQQHQLEHMAYYDLLTGLPNRRMLEDIIKQEYASLQQNGHETAIIILDIDDFKKINDTYGHSAGDSILKQFAEVLKSSVRESDTVARFGGEEFIILFPNASVEQGYAFAERLRERISQESFTIGSVTLKITSSLGVASLSDIHNQTFEDYYLLADKALYVAKQGGKNRVEKAGKNATETL